MEWWFGGIHYADVTCAQSGSHTGFLNILKHGIVKLAVRIHFTLKDVVVRHLGCLLGHQGGLGSVVPSEQMFAALGGLKFIPDSLDDVGALLLEGLLQSCYLSLHLFYGRVCRGQRR